VRRRDAAAPSYGFATVREIAAIFDGSQAKELGIWSFQAFDHPLKTARNLVLDVALGRGGG
jgi:hypothetical protein